MIAALLSRGFGAFSSFKFPQGIQNIINKSYAGYFNIDFSEHEPATSYASLKELFTRELKKPREIKAGFISPSDGKIIYCGKGFEGQAFSIKHHSYDVLELLGSTCDKAELKEGFDYASIYLSPRDYHHFHAPCDFCATKIEYINGALYSVSPRLLAIIDNLYAKNERVIMRCELENGKLFWLVFVAAINVGKIRIEKEPRIQTNARLGSTSYDSQINYKKAEHIGCFELGSTVVIISQKNALNFTIQNNQNVKFAQKIADFAWKHK